MSLSWIMSGGHRRYLACLPPHADFGALPKFRDHSRMVGSAPTIPRSQWAPINRRSIFPAASWILDQNGYSSCVGNGSAAALRRARYLTNGGEDDVPLSPGALYAQINGGSDNGAVISDALTALQQTGTCAYSTVGESPFYTRQLPAGWQQEAARFKISQAYHCQSFDEIGTALQLGFLIVYGIMVTGSFEHFDSNGIAGYGRGPGNHCMHADGMAQVGGQWVLDNVNSWGASWGPWQNGRCYLCEQHFLNGDQPDAFAILAATYDPKEPTPPASA